ncbi:alpha-1,6-mannosyl-glycoprotein 2-beta-N-acetylglucosaminyltransferase-like [Zerene cesonia]|uniref:alpha-1,6-mannosyl-glycoprotein 2-beta-N-acetylglucosaminyltransferase-like n=1 Tax=Zerene cesonia TaxID=33412 RepID=UPI0018E50FC2|nr:alpha-1,6-mannosyl-glycoprotein 2-beta-N-acetylglucosaminyltransferase-like [Zerene cesonia]
MFLAYLIYELKSLYQNPLYGIPGKLQKYVVYTCLPDNIQINVHTLRTKLELLNKERYIFNSDNFRSVEDDTPILVVQVHKDIERLQYLVLSLAQVRDIKDVLIVFSHSFYDEAINRLIRSIDFCKVTQIFYPHSLQLHPHKFPGVDPNDCNGNVTEFCQYRDARIAEKKQHWWWKANFMFERMKWSSKYEGLVLFLEEDNYIAPDLLHMLRYVQKSFWYFPHVDVVSFGKPYKRGSRSDLLILEPWQPPFHVGLAFNASVWKRIKFQNGDYCMYNDYNWNYSLLNMFHKFLKGHADMIACQTPRVLSTREFESNEHFLKHINQVVENVEWFPENVRAVSVFGPKGRVEPELKVPRRGVGGWGDIRDQMLCLDVLAVTTTEEPRYYEENYEPKSIGNESIT